MDNTKAIAILRRMQEPEPYEPQITAEAFEALDMAVEALQSTKRAQLWIPVTERLPEENGRYLVTCTKWGEYEVDWNIFYSNPPLGWLWEQGVSAWRPLPEPWKEGEANG